MVLMYNSCRFCCSTKFDPAIEGNVVFPVKGLYVLFNEVKHQGKIIIVNFMLEVK